MDSRPTVVSARLKWGLSARRRKKMGTVAGMARLLEAFQAALGRKAGVPAKLQQHFQVQKHGVLPFAVTTDRQASS
jgi:hypothetical protein